MYLHVKRNIFKDKVGANGEMVWTQRRDNSRVNVPPTIKVSVADGMMQQEGSLRAVILHHHHHDSVITGHWTAVVQRLDPVNSCFRWFHIDDTKVSRVENIREFLVKEDIQIAIMSCLYHFPQHDDARRVRGGGIVSPGSDNKGMEDNDGMTSIQDEPQWEWMVVGTHILCKSGRDSSHQYDACIMESPEYDPTDSLWYVYIRWDSRDGHYKVLCSDCEQKCDILSPRTLRSPRVELRQNSKRQKHQAGTQEEDNSNTTKSRRPPSPYDPNPVSKANSYSSQSDDTNSLSSATLDDCNDPNDGNGSEDNFNHSDENSSSGTTEDTEEWDDDNDLTERDRRQRIKAKKCGPGNKEEVYTPVATVQQYPEFLNGRTLSYHSRNPTLAIRFNEEGKAKFDFPKQSSGVNGIVTYTPEYKMLQARFANVEENGLTNLTGITHQLLFAPIDNTMESQYWLRELFKKTECLAKLWNHQASVLDSPFQQRTEYKCLRKPQLPPPGHFEPLMPTHIVVPINKRDINTWTTNRLKICYSFFLCLRDKVNNCREVKTLKMNPAKMETLITELRSLATSAKAAILLSADLIRFLGARHSYKFRNPVKPAFQDNDTYDTRFMAEKHVIFKPTPEEIEFQIPFRVPKEGVVAAAEEIASYKVWATSKNYKTFGAFKASPDSTNDWPHLPNLPSFAKHLAHLLPKYQYKVGIQLHSFLSRTCRKLKIEKRLVDTTPSNYLFSVLTMIMNLENDNDSLENAFRMCIKTIFQVLIEGYYEQLWDHIAFVLPDVYKNVDKSLSCRTDTLILEDFQSSITLDTESNSRYCVHVSTGNENAKPEIQKWRSSSPRKSYFSHTDRKCHYFVLIGTEDYEGQALTPPQSNTNYIPFASPPPKS